MDSRWQALELLIGCGLEANVVPEGSVFLGPKAHQAVITGQGGEAFPKWIPVIILMEWIGEYFTVDDSLIAIQMKSHRPKKEPRLIANDLELAKSLLQNGNRQAGLLP